VSSATQSPRAAAIEFKVYPHMLRHACGFKLANDGHDTRSLQAYLGHKNIQHTVRYTELSPTPVQELLAVSHDLWVRLASLPGVTWPFDWALPGPKQ
jgi:site-specific recombinase XerD